MSDRNAELEKEEIDGSAEEEEVVSDSRARRKRNRGEAVVQKSSGSEKKGRPTPSRRRAARTGGGGLSDLPVVGRLVVYVRGVYAEMQKVTWPNREETINLTQVVLAVTTAFAIGLGLVDTFYTWWFRRALEDNVGLFLGIGAVVLLVAGAVVYAVFMRRSTDAMPY